MNRSVRLVVALLGAVAVYFTLVAIVFAPVDKQGARVVHLTERSEAVGRTLGVNVLLPAKSGSPGQRSLLLFLHGRGGSEETFTGNEAVYEGLAKLGARAPVVAFPDGGDHSYWHNRDSGRWDRYLMREVIPRLIGRFDVDPERIAVGGISMGGFGAYNLALHHPARFCAVGGHSAALWFTAGETAPGAFDDAADFNRNDVVGEVRRRSDPFAG
ncbi:MAG TPA: alpha/beta hydrolase-fold protein, partial [Solirubrobacterales bacterium]